MFQVLQSIPWDKVDIRFLVIEVGLSGITFDHKIQDFHRLLESKGYVHFQTANINHIFVKKDYERAEVVRSFKRFLSNDIVYNLQAQTVTLAPQAPEPVPEPLSIGGISIAAVMTRRLRRLRRRLLQPQCGR